MSDSGDVGKIGNDVLAVSFQRQQLGDDMVTQQQLAQKEAMSRNRAMKSLTGGNDSEEKRDQILEHSGPGMRREAVMREGDSLRFRQLSDETGEMDASATRIFQKVDTNGIEIRNEELKDHVQISEEAKLRLSTEELPPIQNEEVFNPEPQAASHGQTVDQSQTTRLSDQIDSASNETPAGRAIGKVLDQFS